MSFASGATDKITDGLTEFGVATGDVDIARAGASVYRQVAVVLDPIVRTGDVCRLAFASMIIRPSLRVECLAVVLGDRLVVAWKAGMFRKPVAEVVPFSSITAIHRERGSGALRGANLLLISGTPNITLALSQSQPDTELAVIRTAIGIGVG